MPLATPPLSITIAPAAALPLAAAVPPGAAVAPNPLNVPQVYQPVEEWCWASCVQMVLNYKGSGAQQCDVVNRQFNQTICCANPGDPACNQPLSIRAVAAVYNSWQVGAQFISSAVQMGYLISEIAAGRPVQVGFLWSGGGGHVALVRGTGVASTGQFVIVNDPKYGTGPVLYVNLLRAYNLGTWQYTWVSIG